jgi:ATP-dependent helicase/nuclease subunit A
MSIALADQLQRLQALDTKRSFIVQAPAGSGKTELLVQRYLALLSESAKPEHIIVLTFTRKAAAEMRQRVLELLQLAAVDTIPPSKPYQCGRWRAGRKLYEWQAQQQWELLTNPDRLQIQTIDAFYAQLVRKAPLQAGWIANAEIVENPEPLYQRAIQKLLAELEADSKLGRSLVSLAHHLNNDGFQIERLLSHMLAHRDQWLDVFPKGAHDLLALRKVLERCLQQLSEVTYQKAAESFECCGMIDWRQSLQTIVCTYYFSPETADTTSLPHSEFWRLVADLLLTAQGQWRRTATHRNFSHYPQSAQKPLKASLKKWLNILRLHEPVRLALVEIRRLPPMSYTEPQWQLLSDLFYILQALVAILNLTFEQCQQVDYIAIALQASRLLGAADHPTELLLSLDYKIQHILVDEFQDTSLQQLRFLQRLTEGWQPHDGRTLFVVGDPMQSIYRFRKAEARLFGCVQRMGLGTCQLEPIALSTNFRATPSLIEWVNHRFESMKTLLQARYNQDSLFIPSTATSPRHSTASTDVPVEVHWLSNTTPEQEAQKIVTLIQLALQGRTTETMPAASPIAVLGRTRQQLLPVLERLRAEAINYQAIEVEALADKPIIHDLLALTRALMHIGDDIAWLAVLRAPWCGATLANLHALTEACQSTRPTRFIWEQLQQLDHLPLTQPEKDRLARVMRALRPFVENYGRAPLRTRVIQAWYQLGGPATQPINTWHPQDVENFGACLDTLQVGETIVDIAALESKLQHTYAISGSLEDTPLVTLMTIHKAKGLEFDTVILPSLHKSTRQAAHPLILFDEFPMGTNTHVLMAPIKASDIAEPDAIYRYLRHLDNQQDQAEVMRLLYVACTRAQKKLHLVGSLSLDQSGSVLSPNPGSFLHWLWPVLDKNEKTVASSDVTGLSSKPLRLLKRMTRKSIYPYLG